MCEMTRSPDFDVVVVGGGPAGLFSAYWLCLHTSLKVCLLERGLRAKSRHCPVPNTGSCMRCKPSCNILCGLGGAGLFSDGKLNFIPKLGKSDLTRFMSLEEALGLIAETETIFNFFGMDGPCYPPDKAAAEELRKRAKIHGIDLLLIRQKHLGSDFLPDYIEGMCSFMEEKGLLLRPGEPARDILVREGQAAGVVTDKGEITSRAVILAPGRAGAEWMGELAARFGLKVSQRGLEVGMRVEVHKDILADTTRVIYDPAFFVQTAHYDDQTRTFCTNPEGFVTLENYEKFTCVNGHAFKNTKSENSNFAFLSKVVLTDPVSDNHGYGEAIGRLASIIGGGKAILQRFGDLKRGRRSTWNRISKGYIRPTLQDVTPGDISMALPERVVHNLVDGLEQLNKVVPGVANEETLLYAPEIKFFSTQIETDRHLETPLRGLFVAGDGPGVSGNIVAAAATGLIPAKRIGEKLG
jgi:uncharacterized FAD-dependent dehydrogenase